MQKKLSEIPFTTIHEENTGSLAITIMAGTGENRPDVS